MGSVVDLIYGLLHQTRAGFADTVERVLDIRPERVALFHYAHVPWMKGHQAAMDVDAMPGAAEKLDIFSDAIAAFDAAGYVTWASTSPSRTTSSASPRRTGRCTTTSWATRPSADERWSPGRVQTASTSRTSPTSRDPDERTPSRPT